MTDAEMKNLLEQTDYPVTNYSWPENQAPALPFICFFKNFTNDFAADGVVYYSTPHWIIELYTQYQDPEAEKKVRKALSPYFFTQTGFEYLEDERCYLTTYEMED